MLALIRAHYTGTRHFGYLRGAVHSYLQPQGGNVRHVLDWGVRWWRGWVDPEPAAIEPPHPPSRPLPCRKHITNRFQVTSRFLRTAPDLMAAVSSCSGTSRRCFCRCEWHCSHLPACGHYTRANPCTCHVPASERRAAPRVVMRCHRRGTP